MAAKAAFAPGDIVTLKGQLAPLTVIPEPHQAISKEGWVWTAFVGATVSLTLLPVECLVKKAPRGRK